MTPCAALASALLALAAPNAAPARVARSAPSGEDAGAPVPVAARAGASRTTPSRLSAAAAPDRVRLGEELVLTIDVRDAKQVRYELPADLSLGKDFDVVRTTTTRSEKDAEVETRFQIRALLFNLGENALADIPLRALTPEGEQRLVVPGPTVTGVGDLKDGDKPELQDIMPPVPVPVPRYTLLYVAGATLAAALLGLLIFRWLKSRPRRVQIAVAAPPLPAHVRALSALEALQREELPRHGRGKELFFRVSEILRDYLGERFGFAALDMTTAELLAALARVPTAGLDYARFEAFCREGDIVRFAKGEATSSRCKQAIEEAFVFVRATTPPGPLPARGATPSVPPGPGQGAAA